MLSLPGTKTESFLLIMSLQLFCAVALLVSSCSEAHFCWIYYKFLVHFSTNIKILWKLKVVSSGRSCGSNASWVGTSTPDSVLCRVQAAAVRALWVATQGNCSYCWLSGPRVQAFIDSLSPLLFALKYIFWSTANTHNNLRGRGTGSRSPQLSRDPSAPAPGISHIHYFHSLPH